MKWFVSPSPVAMCSYLRWTSLHRGWDQRRPSCFRSVSRISFPAMKMFLFFVFCFLFFVFCFLFFVFCCCIKYSFTCSADILLQFFLLFARETWNQKLRAT